MSDETIFALSTARGRAAIAVVRVSGPNAANVLLGLTHRALPPPRRAVVRSLYEAPTTAGDRRGTLIDRGLVLWLPGPETVTGEDIVEFHIHGGRAVSEGLLETVASVDGCRPAEPGEFTRRGFENGRLDLTEVEGVADLICAETAAQRRQAARQMEGSLGKLYEDWRGRLTRCLAHVEAEIDFVEEELPPGMTADVIPIVAEIAGEIGAHLSDSHRGERLRDGYRVAVVGAPNVGKSSLINLLARRDAAIVSETPGTTRDIIEVHLDLGGFAVTVADTAGVRESDEAVEAEGVRRGLEWARAADLRLHLIDARTAADETAAPSPPLPLGALDLRIVNKADLVETSRFFGESGEFWRISAKTGEGVDTLLKKLEERVSADLDPGETPVLTRTRHRAALQSAREALDRILADPESGQEVIAEDLRLACRALGRITGRFDVEDILDLVFSEFCIGK
jgi:tRNA modification GTPase